MIAIVALVVAVLWWLCGRIAGASWRADFAMTNPALYFEDESKRRWPALWRRDADAEIDDLLSRRRKMASDVFICYMVGPIALLGQFPFSEGLLWEMPDSYVKARATLAKRMVFK